MFPTRPSLPVWARAPAPLGGLGGTSSAPDTGVPEGFGGDLWKAASLFPQARRMDGPKGEPRNETLSPPQSISLSLLSTQVTRTATTSPRSRSAQRLPSTWRCPCPPWPWSSPGTWKAWPSASSATPTCTCTRARRWPFTSDAHAGGTRPRVPRKKRTSLPCPQLFSPGSAVRSAPLSGPKGEAPAFESSPSLPCSSGWEHRRSKNVVNIPHFSIH